jgi:hypothetical protein
VALPLTQWTVLGPPVSLGGGLYRFTDSSRPTTRSTSTRCGSNRFRIQAQAVRVFTAQPCPSIRQSRLTPAAAVRGFKARTLVPGLLTLACLLAAAPATAQINYAVSGGAAYVTGSPNASGDIVIASTYNGYPVTSIGSSAFNGTGLTSVTIPDSVTSIGDSAFRNCTSLTNVIIGNSVTNIGYGAFAGCTSLTRMTIPASVINIGSSAFYGCSSLTNFTFLGNAPRLIFDFDAGFAQFQNVGAGAKAYYYCGTTGWGTSYGGLPTVMLCAPQVVPGSAGMKPGGFGFTLTCLTNQTIVEASANLVNWQPIWTNTPPGASAEFVDPEWLLQSNRFYRGRSD